MVRTGIASQIAFGYLRVLRVAAFLVAIVVGAAAAGALIALPLWLFATRATVVYNWFVVVGLAGGVLAAVAARVLRGARRAPSMAGHLRGAAIRAARGAARTLAVAVLAVLAATNLFRTHIGRAFIAIRDQDIAAEVMGVNLFRYKLLAFATSSFFVGVAGALLAQHSTSISWESFTINTSIQYLAMIIIGGLGSVSGSIYGAVFITLLPQIIRSVGNGLEDVLIVFASAESGVASQFADGFNNLLPWLEQGAFGLAIILTLILEPEGLRKLWENIKDYFRLWPFSY